MGGSKDEGGGRWAVGGGGGHCKFVYLSDIFVFVVWRTGMGYGYGEVALKVCSILRLRRVCVCVCVCVLFPFCFCLMKKSKLLRKSFYASFAILANGYPSATPNSSDPHSNSESEFPFDYVLWVRYLCYLYETWSDII